MNKIKFFRNLVMVSIVSLLINVFLTDFAFSQMYPPGSPEYNSRLAEVQEDQVFFKLNEQYITNTIRGVMARYPAPGWYFMDHFLGSGPQTTLSFLADIPIIGKKDSDEFNLGILFTFMAYALDSDNVNINMLGGVDLYLPDKKTKIFTGAYMSVNPDHRRVSDEDMEKYATGEDVLPEGRMVEPYIFIDSPLNKYFRARFDTNVASSFNDIYRMGAGAFLRIMGLNFIGIYDEIDILGGKEKNIAFGGRIGEGDLVSNPNAEVLPHYMLKVGSLYYDSDYSEEGTGFNDSDTRYIIFKWVQQLKEYGKTGLILGGSYKGSDGVGLQAGVFEMDDGLYWLFSVQYNYFLIDSFGPRINKWSYVFKISNAF